MTQHTDMTCRDLIGFIMEYAEGCLSEAQLREFEKHLSLCPSCVNYLNSYLQTIRLGKAACRAFCEPVDQPAAGKVPDSLLKAILAARARGEAPGA